MNTFNIGDTVRVTASNAEWEYSEGQTGVVEYIDSTEPKIRLKDTGYHFTYDLKLVVDEPLAEWEKELLNVTPREIAFSEIQEGDTIRAAYTQLGAKHTREGVVHGSKYGGWFSSEGALLTPPNYDKPVYTLMERPELPKPNPFAEAKVGSLALESADLYTRYKFAENEWKFIYKDEARLSSSGRTNEDMNNGDYELFHIVK